MAKLKINLVIAGRTYPLSVNNTKEEEGMRKAATKINVSHEYVMAYWAEKVIILYINAKPLPQLTWALLMRPRSSELSSASVRLKPENS